MEKRNGKCGVVMGKLFCFYAELLIFTTQFNSKISFWSGLGAALMFFVVGGGGGVVDDDESGGTLCCCCCQQ